MSVRQLPTRHIIAVAILIAASGTGCSTSRFAVGAMVPILENSRNAALASTDVRTFRDAAPSNLFLLEGLIETDPKREDLRLAAAMLYFSYAFLLEGDGEADDAYASTLYLKGFEHARAALLRRSGKLSKVWDAPFEEFVVGIEDVDERSSGALVWTVANWSQFISLHLDSTKVLLDIPRVAALLERACAIDGEYFQGLPYIIRGSLHAFRPPLMGGDPEKSLASFDQAFAVSEGKFLIAHYMYARFYAYRVQDPDIFEAKLQEILQRPDTILPDYRLLNTIAKEKAAQLLGEKDELF